LENIILRAVSSGNDSSTKNLRLAGGEREMKINKKRSEGKRMNEIPGEM